MARGLPATAAMIAYVMAAMAVVAAAQGASPVTGRWCIAKSGASPTALQEGLDFACGHGGADCVPLQASGGCYLPNTVQSHASYAYNSYFQRAGQATTACDFSGTATISVSDPSYGSCTFPSSPSTAGASPGTPSTTTPTTSILAPPPPIFGSSGGALGPPGYGSAYPNVDSSSISSLPFLPSSFFCFLLLLLLLL